MQTLRSWTKNGDEVTIYYRDKKMLNEWGDQITTDADSLIETMLSIQQNTGADNGRNGKHEKFALVDIDEHDDTTARLIRENNDLGEALAAQETLIGASPSSGFYSFTERWPWCSWKQNSTKPDVQTNTCILKKFRL